MKTAAALLALATGASAFTSTQPAPRSTAVRAVIDRYDGCKHLTRPLCSIGLTSYRSKSPLFDVPSGIFLSFPTTAIDLRGKEFKFDPLKLSETYEPFMPWFRECEIRHGRTAMLAVVGFIATDFVRIPGEMYSFEAIPKTIDAHDALLKSGPMYQLLLFIGLFDFVITAPAAVAASKGDREPGGK